jgi:hypothetical protein
MPKVVKAVGGLLADVAGKTTSELGEKSISASGRHFSKEAIDTILSSKGKSVLGESKNASKLFAGEGMEIPAKDLQAVKYLAEKADVDTRFNDYKAAYDGGLTPVMINIADEVNKELSDKAQKAAVLKATNPQVDKHIPKLIEVGGVKHDYSSFPGDFGNFMKESEELYKRPEIKQAFEQKKSAIDKSFENIQKQEIRNQLEYGTEGAFKKKSRFEGAYNTAIRESRDAQSGAPKGTVDDLLGVQAQAGYGVAKGKTAKTAYREGRLGFKPDNKGRLMNLEQHHAAFPNAEGGALMEQQAIQANPIFELAIHRKVAQQYDSAFGAAAKNQANLPYDVHQEMLHRWLEQFNLEDYWRNKLKQNPNMSPQEIVSSIDEYFQEIVYPTMAMLDGWMAKSDPSKFNTADVRIPKKLTQQARKFLKDKLDAKPIDFTRGGTRTAEEADFALDEFRRQTNDGAGMFKLRVPTEGMNL